MWLPDTQNDGDCLGQAQQHIYQDQRTVLTVRQHVAQQTWSVWQDAGSPARLRIVLTFGAADDAATCHG